MMTGAALTRAVLIGVIAGLVGFAGAGVLLQRQSLAALEELSEENLPWSVMQVEMELHRFVATLARFAAADPAVTPEEIEKRYDILWSRVSLFDSGSIGRRVAAYDSDIGAMDALSASLREHEETVAKLSRGRRSDILSLLIAFGFHEPRVRRLASFVNTGETWRESALRDRLERAQLAVGALSLLAVVFSALLAFVVFAEARRRRREAAENARMAARAEAANVAKSRFLSMMSHELRTPMNGVLGQLALARAEGLPKAADALLERAEASGRRLLAMLIDILDFAALQEDALAIRRRPFDPRELAERLSDGGERKDLAVEEAARLPPFVMGDRDRILQAAEHLVAHVLDTAAARNARMLIDYGSGELALTLTFLYGGRGGDQGAGWRPARLLGDEGPAPGELRADSLGPVIARALAKAMGGRIEVAELYEGQSAVTLAIPAPIAEEAPPKVRVETRSQTMKLICEAALRGARADLAPAGAPPDEVDVALMEAGGEDELEDLRRLKRAYPMARVIALGAPARPDAFDEVTPLPLEMKSLEGALRRMALCG